MHVYSVAQSYLTLCDPMDCVACQAPFLCPWDSHLLHFWQVGYLPLAPPGKPI